jgi:hypothetical protein
MVGIWFVMLMVSLSAYHLCFLVFHGAVALIAYGGLVVNKARTIRSELWFKENDL